MGFLENDPVLKIKDSVDVYASLDSSNFFKIQFYHINTRQKLSIRTAPEFSDFLSVLDGTRPISAIINEFEFELNFSELEEILEYLFNKGVLENPIYSDPNSRYSRQINFLSDWIVGITAEEAHKRICDANCVIFGVGAVGSAIAIHLARAGVNNLTLIDHKHITWQSSERHPYFSVEEIGSTKTEALSRYLKRINPLINIKCVNEKLLPLTELPDLVDKATIVINTADEPYIGHTSVKLGRYLWPRRIPMYVAGGFDAHLMSTGDFYIPGESACIDCCTSFFTASLSDWKPTYKIHQSDLKAAHIIGGSGGWYGMSLFSASYSCIQLLNYLAGGNAYKSRLSHRGEFISSKGEIEWVKILPRIDCDVCGK